MFVFRIPDSDKLSKLQNEIEQNEKTLEDSDCTLEIDELKTKIRELENEFRYESETVRRLPYVCKFIDKEKYLLDQRILYAKDARNDTVRSIARATGRRSVNSEPNPNEVLPDKWFWNYT